jgi:hypothetical protein
LKLKNALLRQRIFLRTRRKAARRAMRSEVSFRLAVFKRDSLVFVVDLID